ncbi:MULTISPECIES: large conductance mechanosensitive channel protein MscL [Anaerostipes]|uniref:large conductance mechanosensitive channel protein MscL n=1 Tax=Anaerostipes TaxID=207244 RepID=UPI0009524146|nr:MULTISPECIES: large conductance mechanosensitive channel protein MscL [Anaerostipes]MCI5623282.1 large conductance mechanosensitive channel protein MscL [Anaerostipes sp.]MDY2726601.1 large conductance mechanosensitive channel protein MscL [Anaerostipes faecalis]OLR58368.1 mechanosensitive ion channel protein MscL [Anaerostipes sp. 494a]
MKKKGFIKEFQEFISRGNVIDMAVGVIIGGAFQTIISSLVNDVIMPLISVITGGIDFTMWKLKLGAGADAPVVHYGNLITAIINFLLMAFVIFTFIKIMNNLRDRFSKTEEEVPAAPETKICPFCLSEIPADAVKCAHCTSDLSEGGAI